MLNIQNAKKTVKYTQIHRQIVYYCQFRDPCSAISVMVRSVSLNVCRTACSILSYSSAEANLGRPRSAESAGSPSSHPSKAARTSSSSHMSRGSTGSAAGGGVVGSASTGADELADAVGEVCAAAADDLDDDARPEVGVGLAEGGECRKANG